MDLTNLYKKMNKNEKLLLTFPKYVVYINIVTKINNGEVKMKVAGTQTGIECQGAVDII